MSTIPQCTWGDGVPGYAAVRRCTAPAVAVVEERRLSFVHAPRQLCAAHVGTLVELLDATTLLTIAAVPVAVTP